MALDVQDTRRPSPFFQTPDVTEADSLAILHLRRDTLLPITLRSTADDGYAEGAVTNTRFGSFPHSTLIGLEWGSQVRASKVDTGSRGRKGNKAKPSESTTASEEPLPEDEQSQKKRKPDEQDQEGPSSPRKKRKQSSSAAAQNADQPSAHKTPIEAGSGFVHILPPTPESWTYSLDHRTQVVYTPDSSYILQQLRVRPGDAIIEAGAGSGSFTHAAARAIFNGYPTDTSSRTGSVYSFEFHAPRVATLRRELADHGLDGVVHLTHRDVCADGFALPPASAGAPPPQPVTAIFLDLPAPWLALPHLTRTAPGTPLSPSAAIHLCTFSPCIEQVMATTARLRQLGWVQLRVQEIQHRRQEVRRERVGFREEGLRGVQVSAADVAEAVARLREVERRFHTFNAERREPAAGDGEADRTATAAAAALPETKQDRLSRVRREADARKLYQEGNLVHRTEGEVKTHTSYLVFAVLPRAWDEADERRCEERWSVDAIMKGGLDGDPAAAGR